MKNILVIGGSSGIGKALIQNLLQHNYTVFATYNKNEIKENGCHTIRYDVKGDQKLTDFIPEQLDGLVYCPGSINLKPFHRFKPADFIADYELQVVGLIKVIQTCLPALKKSTQASLVLFSTVAVKQGFAFHSQVSASKGALEGLAKALAAEYAPQLRVNVVAPSLTLTPLAGKLLNSEEKIEAHGNRHPLKRIGYPKDLADMTEFLLSEKSGWITGQVFHVDGGKSSLNS